ncbi:MAG: EAL domain-containing protein, partial [Pseudomonadota bacterium]|nr:EAL domain-containing protein [Pseudomonadota bacterium]
SGKISTAGALIPVAEKMGLIDLIDTMVMEKVIGELRHDKDIVLAFNVSNLTTENPVWLDRIGELVKETPEVASRLIVEITETAAHRDLRRAAFFVASLQALGCQVALDDFGSGYTSFRQLKALSVDMVKIDGAFVKDIARSADNRFFVKTLLDFAQGFGLPTVAEFVENGEITKILMEMGVDFMQGYYFGKPANYRAWLHEGEYSKD